MFTGLPYKCKHYKRHQLSRLKCILKIKYVSAVDFDIP